MRADRLKVQVAGGKAGAVAFESVPAFAYRRGLAVEVPGVGKVACDIAYGGAFYAILPARAFGLDLAASPLAALTQAAGALTDAIRAGCPSPIPTTPTSGSSTGRS